MGAISDFGFQILDLRMLAAYRHTLGHLWQLGGKWAGYCAEES
jgi:hypothetical protein